MSSENPTDIKSESSGATPVDPQQTKKVSLELLQVYLRVSNTISIIFSMNLIL